MKLSTVHYLCWMSVALAAATSGEAWAVSVSKSELAKMEEQVEKQSIEHRKLQAQATQINLELTSFRTMRKNCRGWKPSLKS